MADQKTRIINYRVTEADYKQYEKIKEFITDDLGSDVCFIQWNLLLAFFNGMKQAPPANDVIELKFLRQHIQLNIGCQINYNRMKARRLPPEPTPPAIKTDREFKLPLLLEDFPLLSDKSKDFWKTEIINRRIVTVDDFLCQRTHPFISIGTAKTKHSFFSNLHSRVKHLFTNGFKWVRVKLVFK